MDILQQFGTDSDKETKGAWVAAGGDIEFLIARLGGRQYSRELTSQVERYSAALEGNDDVADDTSDRIMVDLLAKHILLGWKGDVKLGGESLSYSVENAKKLLQIKDFRKWVLKQADTMKNYRIEADKVVEKN